MNERERNKIKLIRLNGMILYGVYALTNLESTSLNIHYKNIWSVTVNRLVFLWQLVCRFINLISLISVVISSRARFISYTIDSSQNNNNYNGAATELYFPL